MHAATGVDFVAVGVDFVVVGADNGQGLVRILIFLT
jgi:hypothetical protein